jgi:hypothetical protein
VTWHRLRQDGRWHVTPHSSLLRHEDRVAAGWSRHSQVQGGTQGVIHRGGCLMLTAKASAAAER